MSGSSPFGDFEQSSPLDAFDDQTQPQQEEEQQDSATIALGPPSGDLSGMQPQEGDEDEEEVETEPMAMPPPTNDSGLGAFEQPASDDELDMGAEADAPVDTDAGLGDDLADDPFATVDGGSSANAGAFDSFGGGAELEVKEEEAAALARWEKERAEVLRQRADKATKDKQAAIDQAKEEISKFYADQDAKVDKQKKVNRGDEKNYRSDMKTTFESGARWEKVGKLISTQPKANEKAGASRVDRMRKLLIQLKTEKKA